MISPARNAVCDVAQVERSLRLLVEREQVFEIRALKAQHASERRRGTVAGYFTCPATAAKALRDIRCAAAVYVTLNVVDPELHGRSYNRLRLVEDRDPVTADSNILRRRWLLIDVDFERAANVSSTDAQHEAALNKAAEIRAGLAELGWPAPLYIDSGNGAHLLYRIDLPADDSGLVGRVLEVLNATFGGDGLKIDCTVSNPSRITKLPGTLVCKGDDTPQQPHRMSRLIDAPEAREVVPPELLEQIVAQAGIANKTESNVDDGRGIAPPYVGGTFQIEPFIARHFPDAKLKQATKGTVWVIDCPWNEEHKGDAHIIKRPDGMLGAACKHDSCRGRNWKQLRELKEPGHMARKEAYVSSVSRLPSESPDFKWPEPRSLPAELPPVDPFDVNLLPKTFRPWVADIAERMQCPPDFPAVAAMVVAAGLLGRKVGIRPKRYDDWLVVANLWAMVIGRPGIMKTPAITEPVNVAKRLEIEAQREHDAATKEFEAAQIVAKVRRKACETEIKNDLKNGGDGMGIAAAIVQDESSAPARRRYLVNDTSVEKLGEILKDNPNGVIVFRDELVGLLKSLEKEGQESSRAFYLEAWNGTGRYTYDRIARGTIDIEAAVISILGGIQPSRLGEYLRAAVQGGTGDDGLMQRYQLSVWPDVSSEWVNVDRWPMTAAKQAAFEAYMRLNSLEPETIGAEYDRLDEDGIPFLHFTADAQGIFDEWRHGLELRLRSGDDHPAIESHLSKYRSLIPSLALLVHLVEGGVGSIDVAAIETAIHWGRYLESHARRIYGAAVHAEVPAAKALARRFLAREQIGDQPGEFTLRDVYRNGWAGLSTKEEAQAGVDLLMELDWLRCEEQPTGGKPKTMYFINPKIWPRASDGTDKTDKSPCVPPEGTPFVSSVSSSPGVFAEIAAPDGSLVVHVNDLLADAAEKAEEDIWTL